MTEQPASTAPAAAAHPLVQGRCPACNGSSLFLGSGGYVTCSRLDCPNPCAADDLMHRGKSTAPVTALYEQWVKAGPPPLGVLINRWWDARLVELREAIRPPAEQPARTTPNNPPTNAS
ncbi:hypothetical protein [Streptomyces canus]|uniref:hypothetical protein n=1 Tax=Streptomyces canus TaxID=58343 RepID=UPI000372B091|nr:hypothetical protein [Streptomyces canus]